MKSRQVFDLAGDDARWASAGAPRRLLASLPRLAVEAERQSREQLEEAFVSALLRRAGQPAARRCPRPRLHAGVAGACAAAANHLRREGLKVGLVTPSPPHLAEVLLGHGLDPVPVGEEELGALAAATRAPSFDALVLASPNDPTGAEPTRPELTALAAAARRHGLLLILDRSLRCFGGGASGDVYASLLASGGEFAVVESTARIWAPGGLQAAATFTSPALHARFAGGAAEGPPPLALAFLAALLAGDGGDPAAALRRVARRNRALLAAGLAGTGVELAAAGAAFPYAWLRLPRAWDGTDLCAGLVAAGLQLLPGARFCWDDPRRGAGWVRLSLLRSPRRFARAVAALRASLPRHRPAARAAPRASRHESPAVLWEKVVRLRAAMQRALAWRGLTGADADLLVEDCLAAQCSGHESHGLSRFLLLDTALRERQGRPRVVREGEAWVLIDGRRELGPLAAAFAVELLRSKAARSGLAAAALVNAGRAGRLSFAGQLMARAGLAGLLLNNAGPPVVAPHGAREALLGTNPICFAFPGERGELVIDLATSAAVWGLVRAALLEGRLLPPDVFLDTGGEPTRDPFQTAAVRCFGGPKGSALGLAVEILGGGLTGARMGPEVTGPYDNGTLLVAFDPALFRPRGELAAAVQRLLDVLRASRGLRPGASPRAPGDGSRAALHRSAETGRAPVGRTTLARLLEMSRGLTGGLEPGPLTD